MGFFDILNNIPVLSELSDTKDQIIESVSPATDAINDIKDSFTEAVGDTNEPN